ncbi:IS1096 element passenger TnpR family protein [Natranaerobius trueperi]
MKIDEFPTLLDGKETAPPEDVGGVHGFYEFLKSYCDPQPDLLPDC